MTDKEAQAELTKLDRANPGCVSDTFAELDPKFAELLEELMLGLERGDPEVVVRAALLTAKAQGVIKSRLPRN